MSDSPGAERRGRRVPGERASAAQATLTAVLREQARRAAEGFVFGLLEAPGSADVVAGVADRGALAKALWGEAFVVVYRLLFILTLEALPDAPRAFPFTGTSLWRTRYSPSRALAGIVDEYKRRGAGAGLGERLSALFRLFERGHRDENVVLIQNPLGGRVFGEGATALVDRIGIPDAAAAHLLDCLLWMPAGGATERQLIDYGRLEVEELGRVYEALLELEPGLAAEPMCRLRRQKLEVVAPAAEGERYRRGAAAPENGAAGVQWVEAIPAGRFYLRAGLGRKATGAYYTPQAFVRFLIEETLGREVAARSPSDDPQPAAILQNIRVMDPAMGSGHFLVEACRFLGDRLYEARRRCEELAAEAEAQAEGAATGEATALRERARELRGRLREVPDLGDAISARRLAALHCLYGVDKNPLAVEITKLSLWLEVRADGLPLTFLDHRLVCGDSIAGPFFEQLGTYPKGGGEVPGYSELRRRAHFAGGPGGDYFRAALPMLAKVWSGGVMLGEEADDEGYALLVKAAANEEALEPVIAARPGLAGMLAAGRGALGFDLTFPDVFYPNGLLGARAGFEAVIGNPPWDAVRPKSKEFFAAIDLRVLDAPTKRERAGVEAGLRADARVAALEVAYERELRAEQRLHERLFKHQTALVLGAKTGGDPDKAKLFAERFVELCRPSGKIGVLLPSAFHANAGATGVRRLYLDQLAIIYCISFENRRRLFEIDSRFKFDLLVAAREPPRGSFACAFYRHDPGWLAGEMADALRYTPQLIAATGGEHRALLELRSAEDLAVAERCFALPGRFLERCEGDGIRFGRELHMTDDAWRFEPAGDALSTGEDPRDPEVMAALLKRGRLLLHDDKTFTQLSDLTRKWRPRYLVPLNRLADRPDWVRAATVFRVAFRKITGATNERTTIAHILPPGSVFGDATFCERDPLVRPAARALVLLGVLTSFSFDWLVRLRAQSNLNLFLMNATPVPGAQAASFIAHAVLRLACNHAGYAALWREQLGDAWREPAPRGTYPVLGGDAPRWAVRARIDAMIADAYGLSRDQYARVLSSFNHKGFVVGPELCLAAFDELKAQGLESFAEANDPYADVPLVEDRPEPIVDLAAPDERAGARDRRQSTTPERRWSSAATHRSRDCKEGSKKVW